MGESSAGVSVMSELAKEKSGGDHQRYTDQLLLLDPGLLDIVPWSHGYAHSWALATLLRDPRTASAVLHAMPDLPGKRPLQIRGPIQTERTLKPARADLAFTIKDAAGKPWPIALETKVNDRFRAEQMIAYDERGYTPLLFMPGLTGVLLEPTPVTAAKEVRLYGQTLLAAIDSLKELTFGSILRGYLEALRAESERIEQARAIVRGDRQGELGPALGRPSVEDVIDTVWLAETYRALRQACRGTGIEAKAEMRIEANDRGFFFAGSFARVANGGLWVDVMVDLRTNRRSTAIKAGEKGLASAWDRAAAQEDGPGSDWWLTSRRVGGHTATVWKCSLDEMTAPEAAAAAVTAAQFIRTLA
jgi:hypothetical protein